MFATIKHLIAVFIISLIIPSTLLAQNRGNDFMRQKEKRYNPGNYVPADENIIDGSLYRSTIFNSSPLFKLNDSYHKTIYVQGNDVPIWIETKFLENSDTDFFLNAPLDIKKQCIDYMQRISHLTKVLNAAEEFEVLTVRKNPNEIHVKLKQKYKGIAIHGSEIYIHFNKHGIILNGRYVPTPSISDVTPVVSENQATSIVVNNLREFGKYRDLTTYEKQLLKYTGPVSELILFRKNDSLPLLAWRIEVRPNPLDHWEYFIDASKGDILEKNNHTCNAGPVVSTGTDLNGVTQTFGTYEDGGTYYMVDVSKPMFDNIFSNLPDDPIGAVWTIDANNTDLTSYQQITSASANSWTAKSISAHSNADSCFKYYKNIHNRNSLDDNGGTIISVINVTDGGQDMDNAYWNGRFMAYGNGDFIFKPLAGSLDVAAHEMTHGVIQNTANLTYRGQSGAINESLADIFGCMVDRNDWHLGEDIMTAASLTFYPTGYLRDLSDPHNGGVSFADASWQPNHMNEFVSTIGDNGGVHTNSGIPNYAYYLFSTAIGKDTSEKVYYSALTNYLTASSKFIDLRLAVIQAASDLYPTVPAIADAARTAFDQVGIVDGIGTGIVSSLPVNQGADFILMNGLDGDASTLYKVNSSGSSYASISTRTVGNKTSITDNGSSAYFVDGIGRIIKKNMSTNFETIIDSSKVWSNVAVSKDGLRLAAVTEYIDSSIYVRQDSGGAWTRFILYNPTFSTGISTAGPQYADALEWNYDGEVLMYDCYNLKISNSGDTIDYWNIGFINVWDTASATYGDGSIKNLFDGLPAYVSIGNPTFAKNSPQIVAFDYIDYSAQGVFIVGANTETGDAGLIVGFNLGMLGFPSYSKNDKKVAFTVFDTNGDTSVYSIGLTLDKISYSSYSSLYGIFNLAKMPVWYATGSRVLGTNTPTAVLSDINVFPNPFNDEVNLEINLKDTENLNIQIFNMLGQPVKTLYNDRETAGRHSYTFSLSDLSIGTYMIKIITGKEAGLVKIIKLK